MPRPSRSYITPRPLESLNMAELKFWLEIMRDHATFIKNGLPCDRKDLIEEAQNFHKEFGTLLNRAEKVQGDKKFNELVCTAYDAIKEFHRYKHHLLRLKISCKLGGYNFPLFLDHVAREAEYAMRLLDKMRAGKQVLKAAAKTQETTFWVRIMGDHAKFISHLLDPSEYGLINTANEYSTDFDELFLQSNDFVSMLHHNDNAVPSFGRFLQDVQASTRELRDFKRAVQDMIARCLLLSLIPEALADHVRREADHFLMLLSMMEKGVIKNISDCPEDELEAMEDTDYSEDSDGEDCDCTFSDPCDEDEREECEDENYDEEAGYDEEEEYESPVIKPAKYDHSKLQQNDDSDSAAEDDDNYDEEREKTTAPAVAEPSPPIAEIGPVKHSHSAAKNKWGGKWPRPLGKKE